VHNGANQGSYRVVRALLLAVAATAATIGSSTAALAVTPRPSPHSGAKVRPTRDHLSYREQLGRSASTQAVGGVQLSLPYSDWLWPQSGYYTDIAETVAIESGTTPGASFFWSHQFSFERGTCTGVTFPCQGYLGLQDGAPGRIALFSIWDANAAQGNNCRTFNGEGAGYSCTIAAYAWQYDHDYVLRVRGDGSGSQGMWFKATVTDSATLVETTIGRIRVPLGWGGIQGWTSWTEYFGSAPSTCGDFPKARARWKYPVANGGAVSIDDRTTAFGAGDCASRIEDVPGGHRQIAPK
jgi:hypothetical protein